MRFQSTDVSHGSLVALKSALMADDEVSLVDRLLVRGKSPPSLSKLLRTSEKMQAMLKEEEVAECLGLLSHFGFAPQRFDSRKVPLGRFAWRLRQSLAVLAAEAESGEEKRRKAAENILEQISGDNTWRLVLAGMLADMTHEYSKFVHAADRSSTDPMTIDLSQAQFLSRMVVLFQEGLILTKAAQNTFTGQVLKFLSQPRMLYFKKKALVLSLGALSQDDDLYLPLNRMRVVLQALTRMLTATRPSFCWAKRFLSFRLPSPLTLAPTKTDRLEADA